MHHNQCMRLSKLPVVLETLVLGKHSELSRATPKKKNIAINKASILQLRSIEGGTTENDLKLYL